MAAATHSSFSVATTAFYTRTLKSQKPFNLSLKTSNFKPISFRSTYPTLSLSRLRILESKAVWPKRLYPLLATPDGDHEISSEVELGDSNEGATIDIKLPRRSLLVRFTCNECGGRTQRLINRLAYERGLVYVQCAGCEQYHKLADNLGLVIEYDLEEEISAESNTDQV
ncbi:hypothetical protein K2173_017107 [Erythroxylum novogranatense]|uniref:DNL-type domain-containing protein n=1 Tax=Erythroxylum novogranatense TaxID=1862640 RepID=A0AAV8U6Y5_9ROSI|nr:hypothetical protein K2173_017107 [Erythroxylum novogranatense]